MKKCCLLILLISFYSIIQLLAYSSCPIKIGEPVPSFTLYDQNKKTITHKDLVGKMVVMNFIFTRCSAPTMCPNATKRMRELSNLVKQKSLQNDIQFITVSFDPKNDTPEVLTQYANGFNVDLSNHSFLTGDPEMVSRLTKIFGIFTVSENGTINHTMKTVIIDKTGKVVYAISQTDWEPKTLFRQIKKNLK